MERFNFNLNYFSDVLTINDKTVTFNWEENSQGGRLKIDCDYHGVYGMGEKFNAFNQKGKVVTNCVEEKFCNQGDKTYCPIPFFITDAGFGIYIDTRIVTTFQFETGEILISMPKNTDIIVFRGDAYQIIKSFMEISGSAKLPPKWSFGPWISANRWNTQEQIEFQLELLSKYQFPATVLVIEAWSDEATFYVFDGAKYNLISDDKTLTYEDFDFSQSQYWYNPKKLINDLHDSGIHLILWQIPVYKKQTVNEVINEQNEKDWEYAIENKLCVFTEDDKPYCIPKGNWFEGSIIPDFTNSKTKDWWFSRRKYLTEIGVDGFKTDGGEFIYSSDLKFFNGETHKEMKNRYAQSYVEAYDEALTENQVLFSRSGYTGQHTTPILWAGDQQSTFEEMRSVLNAGLSAAMTGICFWSFDIAGFAGPLPSAELYTRATQLACFTPVMQWHSEPEGGQFKELMESEEGNNERSPWNIAKYYRSPELLDELRFWHNLRMNLLPYIYHQALICVKNSQPMMRPLIYTNYTDPQIIDIDDEFMLGDSLLIAPVLEEHKIKRNIYFPEGNWFDLYTGKKIFGKQYIDYDCKNKIPVFIKEGTGIAMNLDDTKEIGTSVGNHVNSYTCLCFMLAGTEGRSHYSDDLGNDFYLNWKDSIVDIEGTCITNYSARVLS